MKKSIRQISAELTKGKFGAEYDAMWAGDLERLVKGLLRGTVTMYADVVSVSSSGMSRKIRFHALYKREGRLENVTPLVCVCYCGHRVKDDWQGFRVGGCGMDMISHTLEEAFYRFHKSNMDICNALTRYTRL